jgi:hypothetical protein
MINFTSRPAAMRFGLAFLTIGMIAFFSPGFVETARASNECSVSCKNGSCQAAGNCTCTCTFWTSTAVCSCSGGGDQPIQPET